MIASRADAAAEPGGRSTSGWLAIGVAITSVVALVGVGCDRLAATLGWVFPSFGYLVTAVLWKMATIAVLLVAVSRLDDGRLDPVNLGLRRPMGWTRTQTKSRARPAVAGLVATIVLAGPLSLIGSSLGNANSYGGRHTVGMALLISQLLVVYPLTVLAEELLFRGWLQPKLGTWGPILAGLLFAAQHLQQWKTIPSLIPLGIGLGIIRWWSGTIRITGALHYLSDSLFFILNYT